MASSRRAGRDRTEVLDAAVRVIAERGADATRFQDVASASGVAVSTLQYYFGSREDLLIAAFHHASETEIAALRTRLAAIDDPWERLTSITDAALRDFPAFGEGSGRLWIEAWHFALRDSEMRTDVLSDYAAWRGLIAEAVAEGGARGVFPAAAVAEPAAAGAAAEPVATEPVATEPGPAAAGATAEPVAAEAPARVATLLLALLDGLGMALSLDDPAVSVEEARESALGALAAILGYRR